MSGTPTDSPALAPDGDDAFNAALVELEEAGTDAPAAAAGDDGGTPGTPPAEEAASTEPAGDQGQAAGDPAPAGAPTDDVWKDVPEAARAQYEKLQRDFMAASGRLSAADRRANQLAQQLQQSSGQTGNQPAEGSQVATPTSAKALLESDRMKRLTEEYPDILGPVSETLGALAQQVESLAVPVQSLNEQQVQQDVQARYDALAERHPDWQQLANDARWPNFLAQAPRFVREMHARNVDVSDPEEAADVLGRFKEFIGVTATPTPAPAPTPTPAADPRRQRQLDAGRDGGSNGAGAASTGIPDDFDAAVAAYASKADAQGTRPIR